MGGFHVTGFEVLGQWEYLLLDLYLFNIFLPSHTKIVFVYLFLNQLLSLVLDHFITALLDRVCKKRERDNN